MSRTFRPLLGFGPWGWVLLPVAAALAYCYFGGYDLRIAVMGWYSDRYGWNSLNRLLIEHLWPYTWSLTGVIAGPATLISVLPAMFISPRRWAWWLWPLVTLWLVLNPALWWWTCRNLPRGLAPYLGWQRQGSPEILGVTLAQLAVFGALAWAVAGRRSAIILLSAGLILGVAEWGADWWANALGRPVPRAIQYLIYEDTWLILGLGWHAAVFLILVGSVVAIRRRAAAEVWRCPNCNYDRRGLSSAKCPECGHSDPAPSDAAVV